MPRGSAAILLLWSLFGLGGCNSGPDADLLEYVNKVKSGELSRNEMIPKAKEYTFFRYEADRLRDPFQLGGISPRQTSDKTSGISPDKERKREPLEDYPLDTLRMVGVISVNNKQWAMIQTTDGQVYRVTVGHHLGQNHGRITAVKKNYVQIVEIVSDGLGGWTEREASLSMTER
jgi:type IV pilus assembly protein PilP